MGKPTPIQVGDRLNDPTCCGSPMRALGDGIHECRHCDCYLITDSGVVETVYRCSLHA